MSAFGLDRAVAADAAAVSELVVALEASLYGRSAFSRADLESEWSELDLQRDVRVVRDGARVVGYGAVRKRGELGRVEGCVHPDSLGRGIGRRIATELEAEDHTPRDFESWAKRHLESERFDPTLSCVVRAGPEIVADSICTSGTYGGGFVHALFTRRGWRRQGVGAAVLRDSFRRLGQAGEHSVGLAVDAASDTGAFRLYERAGMVPALGGVAYEKQLGDAS